MTSLIAHRELRFRREFRQADKFDALDQARDFRAGGTSPCDGERLLKPRKRLTLCVTPRDPQTLEEGRQRFAIISTSIESGLPVSHGSGSPEA